MADPTDEDLEQIMRAGLAGRAGQVDTDVPIRVNRPRSRGWVLPAAAAAAVGILIVAALVLPGANVPVPPSDDRTLVANPPVPSNWRLESWHGVQVSVPPDWGWGGAPTPDHGGRSGTGDLLDCGTAAYRSADGNPTQDTARPYVGRPVMMTDACSVIQGQNFPQPKAPYVWLGAAIEPGTRDLGGGWKQTTIEAGGSTVTVATRDDSLSEQILATVKPNPGTDCEAEFNGPRVSDFTVAEPSTMSVCAYRRSENAPGFKLQYATEVDAEASRKFLAAVDAAPKLQCIDTYTDEWVVLRIHGEGGKTQIIAVDTADCVGVHTSKGTAELNVATVSPWAVDGIPAYVIGPRDTSGTPGLSDYFRGMLG
ncbi:hypothetical protein [Microlunatus parietis]|uniref:Uncharacterized protein n=1 Tax=Microlunatus parietis TaxID=682979 RepID=A0A7Y9I510_9ACTN|nr:hypothetical protein [Microlunatus parietis]NYE70374.1 hypothetical protein [Microlunatus parietis]